MLKVIDLTVIDAQGNKQLDNVSFSIAKGEVVAVLGPNGAGKTTLLRCLFGAIKNYRGKILINNQDIAELSDRQRALHVAAVSQEMPADFQLSVKTIIETGRTPHQHWLSKKDDRAKTVINSAINRLHLTPYLDRDINTLSGGEKKRVMICRALVQEPELLILDEPCNHLDIEHQLDLMQQLRQLSLSCLVSLHDFPLAARYCDRLIVLKNGRLINEGPAESVLQPEMFEQVFSVHVESYTNPWQQWAFCATSLTSPQNSTQRTAEAVLPSIPISAGSAVPKQTFTPMTTTVLSASQVNNRCNLTQKSEKINANTSA